MIGTMSSPSSFEGGGGPSSRKMEKERRRGTRWSELISRDSAPWYSANPYFPPIHREWRKSSLVSRVHAARARVGNLFHERLSCLLFYRSRPPPPPPFSPVAHAIASGYRPFLGSVAQRKDETRLNELAP